MEVWLANYRLGKNLTQQAVAESSGIQRSYYTMIENGTRQPSVSVAKRIAITLAFDWTLFYQKD